MLILVSSFSGSIQGVKDNLCYTKRTFDEQLIQASMECKPCACFCQRSVTGRPGLSSKREQRLFVSRATTPRSTEHLSQFRVSDITVTKRGEEFREPRGPFCPIMRGRLKSLGTARRNGWWYNATDGHRRTSAARSRNQT